MTQPGESDESGARGGKVSHGSAVTHAHQWGKLCMAISTTERGRGREKSGVVKSQSFCDSLLPQFGLTCIPGSYLDISMLLFVSLIKWHLKNSNNRPEA